MCKTAEEFVITDPEDYFADDYSPTRFVESLISLVGDDIARWHVTETGASPHGFPKSAITVTHVPTQERFEATLYDRDTNPFFLSEVVTFVSRITGCLLTLEHRNSGEIRVTALWRDIL